MFLTYLLIKDVLPVDELPMKSSLQRRVAVAAAEEEEWGG